MLGYRLTSYRFPWLIPAAASDIITAIIAVWLSEPTLTAISSQLWYGEKPPTGTYPYVTLEKVGSQSPTYNTQKGYWESKVFEFSVVHTDQDLAVTYGETLIAIYDDFFQTRKFMFSNGYQIEFKRVGDDLIKISKVGTGPLAQVAWKQCYQYKAKVGRTLPA